MKVTAHLHYCKNSWDEEDKFELWPCKFDEQYNKDKMFIKTIEVEVEDTEVPTQEELTHWLVTGLRKQKETIQAETHQKIAALDEQIQQLLCLPAPAPQDEIDDLFTSHDYHDSQEN